MDILSIWPYFVIAFGAIVFVLWRAPVLATIWLVAGIILTHLTIASVSIIPWIIANPVMTILAVASYYVAGIVYSFLHWNFVYLKSHEAKSRITKAYDNYLSWSASKFGQSFTPSFIDFRKSGFYPFGWKQDNRNITQWVLWWPLAFLFQTLGPIINRFIELVGKSVGRIYGEAAQRQAEKILSDRS